MLDVIGIGLGPFNLSLATLLANANSQHQVTAKFFEQRAEFNWHKGMILPHTTLQVPFLADLVTLIDPTSPYTFLNYLHKHQRLLKFYFVEDFKIARKEYNHYCQWVTKQLDNLHFDSQVLKVVPRLAPNDGFEVSVRENGQTVTYHTKNIVVGTGTYPTLPHCLQAIAKQAPHLCMHSAHFSDNFDLDALLTETSAQSSSKQLPKTLPKILILGSGQSSAEVYRELFDSQLNSDGTAKFQLDWLTRSAGFFPMEYSPLGLEHFSPAYTDYFYQLDEPTKQRLLSEQDLLYKGMGFSTIVDIYHRLYERSIANQQTYSQLMSNCALLDASLTQPDTVKQTNEHAHLPQQGITLTCQQIQQNKTFTAHYDCVIAGTGYQHRLPACLDTLLDFVDKNDSAQPKISRDYQLAYHGNGNIFVQNQELYTHGVGAPDLGLGAYRAGVIANQLLGETYYDTEALTVFQQFGQFS
ncbi:lysine N(6)-hydroxylase/L-ornithine N(5)-oxygenase family protein [Psychrobacter sp. I-STPA6b]|uniref:lysine N(6)-hydroxylase/L-ornithine N(5)-oxygenase family protein n=1 Tax=Psychrobacter sp. I-STPA6b TaxID=2585718 RepID=UPI001D0C229D|nr:SidA/IucD/PvdA family monooxygenase [Psychrobacter sp. I-STPA6b]